MFKNFLAGFRKRPEISYPTMVFAVLTIIACLLVIIADCNDGMKSVGMCKFVTLYFGALTMFSPWVDQD